MAFALETLEVFHGERPSGICASASPIRCRLCTSCTFPFFFFFFFCAQVRASLPHLLLLTISCWLRTTCIGTFEHAMAFQWEKYEAWRKHPMLTNNLRLRHSLPGLGIAAAAFAAFVAYDKLVAGNSGGHH